MIISHFTQVRGSKCNKKTIFTPIIKCANRNSESKKNAPYKSHLYRCVDRNLIIDCCVKWRSSHSHTGARIEIILLKLSLYTMNNRTSHIGAWIETMKKKRNTKGGRNAQTIEILLRADHR